jgi:hypothetical protein
MMPKQVPVRRVRVATLVLSTVLLGNAGCPGCADQGQGNLQVISNGKVAFQNDTGFAQSFFSSDNALGPAQLIPFSSNDVTVRYHDDFSTFSSDPNVNGEQEEVVVMARDPREYRSALESISGPSSDALDVGDFLDWSAQTFAPGDTWPVQSNGDSITVPPAGVTLPRAVRFPYPNAANAPQTDWSMTQDLFTGSTGTDFAGPAASFGGTVKAISVMQRGACSVVNTLQDQLGAVGSAVPLRDNFFFGGYDATLGLSSFVSYAPRGGFVMMLEADAFETLPYPPFLSNPVFDRNVTYFFGLEDGIFSIGAPTFNIDTQNGFDSYALGNLIDNKLKTDAPDTVKLEALEGPKGKFSGGQAQAIVPNKTVTDKATGKPIDCSDTSGPRSPQCFIPCEGANGVDMNNPWTWPSPEDVGDPSSIDPPSWHTTDFCNTAAAFLRVGVAAGAAAYPGMSSCGPTGLVNAVTEPMPVGDGTTDDTKFHDIRCNFHPRYVAATTTAAGRLPIVQPVCEVVTRVSRLNVFPDTVEAVLLDAPDLEHIPASMFGDCTSSMPVGDEAVGIFMALRLVGSADAMCQRQAESFTDPHEGLAPFAHALFR